MVREYHRATSYKSSESLQTRLDISKSSITYNGSSCFTDSASRFGFGSIEAMKTHIKEKSEEDALGILPDGNVLAPEKVVDYFDPVRWHTNIKFQA